MKKIDFLFIIVYLNMFTYFVFFFFQGLTKSACVWLRHTIIKLVFYIYLSSFGITKPVFYCKISAKHRATPFIMYLSVKDPEYLKKLLNSPNALNKGFTYKFLEWKRSLLTADGKINLSFFFPNLTKVWWKILAERWHPLRRYFNKAFTHSNLKTFVGVFDKNSRKLTNRIEHHVGKGDFELMDYVLLTALSNVCGKIIQHTHTSKIYSNILLKPLTVCVYIAKKMIRLSDFSCYRSYFCGNRVWNWGRKHVDRESLSSISQLSC